MIRNKRRGQNANRRLFLEGLEQRSMLAGNVWVEVSGSTLKIKGDNDHNAIIVTQLEDDVYAVAGFNGTRINGHIDPPVVFIDEHIKNIEIDMKRGDDICAIGTDVQGLADIAAEYGVPVDEDSIQVLIDFVVDNGIVLDEEFELEGKLKVNMNDGVDAFAMVGADIEGTAVIDGGKHGDLTVIRFSQFGDDLSILNSEKGNVGNADFVEITECLVEDTASVKTGDGADTVLITLLGVKELHVETGNHSDFVGIDGVALDDEFEPAKKVTVNTGAFGDEVDMRNVLAKDIYVDTGAAIDFLTMNDVFATHDLYVKTGAGDDQLFFGLDSDLGVGAEEHFCVDTGAGNDFADLENIFGGELLEVLMGAGDDALIFSGEGDKAILDGGKGLNLLEILFEDFEHGIKTKKFFFEDLGGGGGGGGE